MSCTVACRSCHDGLCSFGGAADFFLGFFSLLIVPQSYHKKNTHARKNATILHRGAITKPIRLVDWCKEVFYTHSKGICNLVQPHKRRVHTTVDKLSNLLF